MGSGIILHRVFRKVSAGKSLEEYSWAEISEISLAGKASEYWNVGDTKTVDVDGETRTVRLIGFNHFHTVPEESTAGMVFEFVEPLADLYAFDTGGTNDWSSSSLRTYLNGTFVYTLPEDLQDVLVGVYPWNMSDGTLVAAYCRMFILSAEEYDANTSSVSDRELESTEPLEYYANGGTQPWTLLTGEEDTIMTRSAVDSEDWTAVITIMNDNRIVQWAPDYESSYICPCFCV